MDGPLACLTDGTATPRAVLFQPRQPQEQAVGAARGGRRCQGHCGGDLQRVLYRLEAVLKTGRARQDDERSAGIGSGDEPGEHCVKLDRDAGAGGSEGREQRAGDGSQDPQHLVAQPGTQAAAACTAAAGSTSPRGPPATLRRRGHYRSAERATALATTPVPSTLPVYTPRGHRGISLSATSECLPCPPARPVVASIAADRVAAADEDLNERVLVLVLGEALRSVAVALGRLDEDRQFALRTSALGAIVSGAASVARAPP